MNKWLAIFIPFTFSSTFVFAQADLTIVGGINVVSPNPVHVGITVNITFTVQNTGSSTAAASRTGIYIAPDANNPETGVLVSEISLESLSAGGSSQNIQVNFPIPYSIGNTTTYYIIVKLNNDLGLAESNYSNNQTSAPIVVDDTPWAAQNIPYPVIFIHGYMSDNVGAWDLLLTYIKSGYGWSYGGNMDFCLNADGDLSSSVLAFDYHDFINDAGHTLNPNPSDLYTINFAVNPNGVSPYDNSFESNQAGIVKQGLAVRDAISHVLEITGKDKVILVCHSMGGLAAREYLQNPNLFQSSDGKKHVAKLFTIGTPHGGTNIFASPAGGIWQGFDGSSEAIRDLRTSYFYSGAPGAFLFGGHEDDDYMKDQLFSDFNNVDVNCNGNPGDWIDGINQKPIPTDLIYTCAIGSGNAIFGMGSDGVVGIDEANLNNYRSINADTIILRQPLASGFPWHTKLTEQFSGIIRGLDEPGNNYNNHSYDVSLGQLYYGTTTNQSGNFSARDYDYYKVHTPGNGNLNIQISNITSATFSVEVKNSANISVYSVNSNSKSWLDVNIPVASGSYYVILSGIPSANSYEYPYAFKFTFTASNIYCSGLTNLTDVTGIFTDGSGNSNYSNNSNCSWKIQPSGATSITLGFDNFDLSDPGDSLYVYDGPTITSSLLGKWTGSSIPANVISTGGIMLVVFVSDGANTSSGWTANYTSVTVPTYCNGTTNLTQASGNFSDGSGPIDYGNYSRCSWLINPTGAFGITLNFSSFNTETTNDVVNVYDGSNNTSPLLGSFSGNSIPSSLTSSGGLMFVEFLTNSAITAAGWNASYTSDVPFSGDGIVEYQYWFDASYASMISVPIMPQSNLQLNMNISSINLSVGLHTVHIRFRDNNDHWSSIKSNFIYKPPIEIQGTSQYEYWFDNSYSSKTSVNNTLTTNFILLDNINMNALNTGLHSLHIRFRPNGKAWSSTVSTFFYRPELISAGTPQYEYWFDNNYSDKALINNSSTNDFVLLDNLITTTLTNGLHTLHFRFRPDGKTWSSTSSSFFYKDNDILTGINNLAKYVYWFDNNWQDPKAIIITGAQDINWTLNTNVDSLAIGPHTLSQTFKDERGKWSSIVTSNFTKDPVTNPLCEFTSRVLWAGVIAGTGSTFQWQLDTGTGFADIANSAVYSGVTTDSLHFINAPTSWYGYKYRCLVVNGTNTIVGDTITLKFAMSWNGSINNAWENPANWNCNAIPDANTDVYINAGATSYPQVNNNESCRKLLLQPGTSIEIKPNKTLTVTGKD
jgi:pimeloyl-ACP methyl ester carboxylesterase